MTALHPDDVTILFLDYEVIIFDDVNPLGYCDVTVSLCPWRRTALSLLLTKFEASFERNILIFASKRKRTLIFNFK